MFIPHVIDNQTHTMRKVQAGLLKEHEAGLPTYLEFGHVMGLRRLLSDRLQPRKGDHGWTDDRPMMALVLLN